MSTASAPAAEQPAATQPAAAATKPDEKSTAMEIRASNGDIVSYDYGADAGIGSATLPSSGFLPFLSVVNALSKVCEQGHEKFNAEAKAGMFILSGDEPKLYDGKAGLIFVPIHDRAIIIEKTALDGTGKIIAEHPGEPESPMYRKMLAEFGNKSSEWKHNGNFMVPRHNVTGVVFKSLEDFDAMRIEAAVVIGFERTNMEAYRSLTTPFNKIEPKKRPPLFAIRCRLTTEFNKWDKGSSFNFALDYPVQGDFARSLIAPNHPLYADWSAQCKEVRKNIDAGKITAKETGAPSEGHADGGKGPAGKIPF